MKMHLIIVLSMSVAVSCSKKDSSPSAPKVKAPDKLTVSEEIRTERQASTSREQSMMILRDTKSGLGEKMVAATNYFKALGIQTLAPLTIKEKNLNTSISPEREDMYVKAIEEFSHLISDIAKAIRPKQMSPMIKGKSAERAFYAIAYAMSTTLKAGQVSFYDLVRQAMINEANGVPLLRHEELLMADPNKTIMINLVKARLDIHAFLALKGLTTTKNLGLLQISKRVVFELSLGLFMAIDLPETFYTSSDITKDQVVLNLDEAKIIKDFLREFQISKDLEKRLRSAFMKIDLKAPKKKSGEDEEMDEEEAIARQRQIKRTEERKQEIREKIDYLLQ